MTVTMTSVWEETQAFVRKEWSLLAPLALATLGIGNAGIQLMLETAAANGASGLGLLLSFGVILFFGLVLVGQLSITAMSLRPGQTVGEALQTGLSAFGRLIVALAALGSVVLLLSIPLAYMMAKSGVSMTTVDPKVPLPVSLYALIMTLAMIFVAARLFTIIPVLIESKLSISKSFRHAWRQTGPFVWSILAVMILFSVVVFVVSNAFKLIFGMIFSLIAKAAGAPFLGLVLTALVAGMISAGFGIISNVFVAKLYARIGGAGAA